MDCSHDFCFDFPSDVPFNFPFDFPIDYRYLTSDLQILLDPSLSGASPFCRITAFLLIVGHTLG